MNFLDAKLSGTRETVAVDCGDFALALPPGRAEQMRPQVGQNVVFGIRPEHIYRTATAPADVRASTGNFSADIDVVEPLGATVLAYLKTAAHSFTASLDVAVPLRAGERVEITLDMTRCHLFDATDGATLFSPR